MRGLVEFLAQRMFETCTTAMNGFGNDRDCYLLGQNRTDVEANRSRNTFEAITRYPFAFELLEDRPDLALAADHTDESGVGLNGPAQHILIFLMAARDDNDVGV